MNLIPHGSLLRLFVYSHLVSSLVKDKETALHLVPAEWEPGAWIPCGGSQSVVMRPPPPRIRASLRTTTCPIIALPAPRRPAGFHRESRLHLRSRCTEWRPCLRQCLCRWSDSCALPVSPLRPQSFSPTPRCSCANCGSRSEEHT